jgi:hypothetical protein
VILTKIGHAVVWLLMRGGFLVAGAGPLLFAAQCLVWLRLGTWQSINAQTVWDAMDVPWPRTDWIGAQKIIDSWLTAALQLPLAFVLLILGICIVWLGTVVYDAVDSPAPLANKPHEQDRNRGGADRI